MKIFGIPLRIDPTFFVVVALLGLSGGGWNDIPRVVLWVAIVLVSIVIHELGHALTARAFGQEPRILLHGMGGTTSWRSTAGLSWWRHLLVTLAGPFAGFATGALVLALSRWQADAVVRSPLLHAFVQDALWVNVGWGVLNLLPILPLDGGNALATVLTAAFGPRARRIVLVVGIVLSVGIAVFALWKRELWIAFLGGWFALSNLQGLKKQPEATPVLDAWGRGTDAVLRGDAAGARAAAAEARGVGPQGGAVALLLEALAARLEGGGGEAQLARVPAELRDDPAVRGLLHLAADEPGEAADVLTQARAADPRRGADALLAAALVRAGRSGEALEIARRGPENEVSPGFLGVLQKEGYAAGDLEVSAEAGRMLFERRHDPAIPYNVACALSRLGRLDEAVAWLERAKRAGGLHAADLAEDPDLAPLRGRPDFEALRRGAA